MNFEKKKDYIHFKLIGNYNDLEDFKKIKDLCEIPKQHGYTNILVDVRDLNYFFDIFRRFELSKYWAKLSSESGFIKTAILGIEGKMNKFSEDVICNRGGNFKLFIDELEAINWLKIHI
jgi:hypothetical protein